MDEMLHGSVSLNRDCIVIRAVDVLTLKNINYM